MNTVGEGVVYELVLAVVVAVKSAVGSHPQLSIPVTEQGDDRVSLQRGRVGFVVKECLELISVEAVETVVSCNPYRPFLVLTELRNETA